MGAGEPRRTSVWLALPVLLPILLLMLHLVSPSTAEAKLHRRHHPKSFPLPFSKNNVSRLLLNTNPQPLGHRQWRQMRSRQNMPWQQMQMRNRQSQKKQDPEYQSKTMASSFPLQNYFDAVGGHQQNLLTNRQDPSQRLYPQPYSYQRASFRQQDMADFTGNTPPIAGGSNTYPTSRSYTYPTSRSYTYPQSRSYTYPQSRSYTYPTANGTAPHPHADLIDKTLNHGGGTNDRANVSQECSRILSRVVCVAGTPLAARCFNCTIHDFMKRICPDTISPEHSDARTSHQQGNYSEADDGRDQCSKYYSNPARQSALLRNDTSNIPGCRRQITALCPGLRVEEQAEHRPASRPHSSAQMADIVRRAFQKFQLRRWRKNYQHLLATTAAPYNVLSSVRSNALMNTAAMIRDSSE